jgi:sensor histidine kinase YesM
MAEARLQVMQAQIEPHFLFNTLANVRRLYEIEPASADTMLDNLMRYLTIALPQIRTRSSTLGREADLAEAYLNIHQMRMGQRLEFVFEIADRLRGAQVPPIALLTLIENAVKHGLNPLPKGGFIHVQAVVEDGQLIVHVTDTGRGFAESSGVGTGLANLLVGVSNRSTAPRDGCRCASISPVGVTATFELPHIDATVDRSGR